MNMTFPDNFHRSIVFSNVPLSGGYRYKDIFQIYPGPDEWPPFKAGMFSNQPIVFEYDSTYYKNHVKVESEETKSTNSINEAFRHFDFRKELLALLNLVSNANFYIQNYSLNREELGEKYFIPGFSHNGEADIDLVEPLDLYSKEYTLGDIQAFPLNIETILDSYFQLDDTLFQKFRASNFLFYNSVDILEHSPSMCFLAMISAIENLVELERIIQNAKFETCKSCNSPKYKISRRFLDFVTDYSYNDTQDYKNFVKLLYSKRSDIAHLGKLLYRDQADTELDLDSMMLLKNTRKTVKLVMINWLIRRYNENSA